MTIVSTTARQAFVCNGSTTVFPVDMQAYLATDFLVLLSTSAGIVTTLQLGGDYTLAPTGSDSPPQWNLTTQTGQFTSPYASVYTLQVILNPTQTQQTSYPIGQAFPSTAVQQNFDRLTSMVLRLQDEISRALRAPDGDINPLMTLPSAGLRANLAPIFDSNGNIALGALVAGTISTSTLAPFLNLAPGAGEVGVVNEQYQRGDWARYGADPSNPDNTAAINNALASASYCFESRGLAYTVLGTLLPQSGQIVAGVGSDTLINSPNGINCWNMTGLTGTTVRDMHVARTGGTVATCGSIAVQLCTDCNIEKVEFSGHAGFGIWINCSNQCNFERNNFHDAFLASPLIPNFSDIGFYCTASTTLGAIGNKVINNTCNGGNNEFGISIEDPDTATSPSGFVSKTLISGNLVDTHTGYGILHYQSGASGGSSPGPCDSYNKIVNNDVRNINALIALNPPGQGQNTDAGAGIYSVGVGSGGLIIEGNTIFNCCVNTLTSSLAPAGIGVNQVSFGLTPTIIRGNHISAMSRGHGILVVSSPGGAIIGGNSINMPSTNTGIPNPLLGPGSGIRVEKSSNVVIEPNNVQVYGAGSALFLYANGANMTGTTVTGGYYQTNGAGQAFQATQNGGFNIDNLSVTGVNFNTQGSATAAVSANAMIGGGFSNVIGISASGTGILLNGCTNVSTTGGNYQGGNGTAIATAGICTGSYFDISVQFFGGPAAISNAGTGSGGPPPNITFRTNANPSGQGGVFQPGDRAQNWQPVVGSPKGWVNALSSGWVSEGTL